MRKHIRCGRLFSPTEGRAKRDQTVVVDDGEIVFVGATGEAPRPGGGDERLDYSDKFVLPGLIDAHVHLSYGNAQSEEDIDIFAPVEFRALRGLHAARCLLKAGFTSIADPAISGVVSLAVRDAIEAGMFVGPRITSAGRQITNRQGLSDWYPVWIGVPETSVGVLARDAREGIAEIRRQVKQGVDFIKIAMDGDVMNPATGLVSGYTQDETTAMVAEAHRLGRTVWVHARGAEAVLYSARAGADVIIHASWMDDEGLQAVVDNGCTLMPTLSLLINDIAFTQPTDGCHPAFPDGHRRELQAARTALVKAREAGVPFMLGTDSGFAVTPYGEWNAKELEYYVRYLGFSPAEALRSATVVNSSMLRHGDKVGALEPGRQADLLVLDGDPLADLRVLQDRARLVAVMVGGKQVELDRGEAVSRAPLETSYAMWGRVYTRERVQELMAAGAIHGDPLDPQALVAE